jgi:hypothetical protein
MTTTRSRHERAKLAYTLKSPQRKEFFRVWDARPEDQNMRDFCVIHKDEQWCPSKSHGYRWLKEREKIIKEGLGSPTRRLPPQKPQGRPKKDVTHVLEAMTERPPSQTIKQYVAQSGVAASTLYCQLKALREQQITPVVPSHTLESAGNNSAGRQHRSSGSSERPATTQTITNQASKTTDRHTLSMSANQDRSVAASGSGSQLYKPREQTSVACNLCRRHKSKVSVARAGSSDRYCNASHTTDYFAVRWRTSCMYTLQYVKGRLPLQPRTRRRSLNSVEAQV